MFKALVLDRVDEDLDARVRELSVDDLPDAGEEEVRVEVLYSSLNYKDALALTGRGKIIRGEYPIVPGIDLVGRVVESAHPNFSPGDRVIGTGWQLGEVDWGGYSRQAKVEGRKLVALPEGLSPKQAMVLGTAGLTSMLSVMALEGQDVAPEDGEVVVTGASGGAGSVAVALLNALGYTTVASTGSEEAHDYLHALGAERIVHRKTFEQGPERPLESASWTGAVDAVGGTTLATLISQLQRHGSVASFGNAGGHELHTSVFPFILRGVNLLGIDSNTCPNDRRRAAWARLADVLTDQHIEQITARTIPLEALPDASRDLLSGEVRGRIAVDVQA